MIQTLSQQVEQRSPSVFRSILFDDQEVIRTHAPDFFHDLNLDQIVDAITTGRDEYELKPFFYTPLSLDQTIRYRQDVFRDLEDRVLLESVRSFAQEMRDMRTYLAEAGKRYYKPEKQALFLDAVDIYCKAAKGLKNRLLQMNLRSRGFVAFIEYLTAYTDSADFTSLATETDKLKDDLAAIRYCLHIHGNRITVSKYSEEPDYSAEVLRTFDKFKQGAPKEYRFDLLSYPEMNHVEAAIVDLVAQLYPEVFSPLNAFYTSRRGYVDGTIAAVDREMQFYLAVLEHIERFKHAGLSFCYPAVTNRFKEVCGEDTFDLALAHKLVAEKRPTITNDFFLKDPERIFVVSGPNQGGKTTFARFFGQLHYLAAIGCPVPGTKAALFLFDGLFTHFEREEDIHNLSGKLEDDLVRIHRMLESATPNSILIMNESFLSTSLKDALFLSREIMQRIIELDMLCVSVTFLDELSSLGKSTVSMVSTVNPEDPALRTFKIIRKPADGLAYAVAIAEKYRLTYDQAKSRIAESTKGRIAP